MEIILNGEARTVSEGLTLADLVRELNMQPRFVAIECNTELVPRRHHAEHVLQPGDCVEIVTLVGGG